MCRFYMKYSSLNHRQQRRGQGQEGGEGGGGGASPNKNLRVLRLSPEISVKRFCFGTDIDCSKLGQQLHPIHDAVKTALPTVHQATNIRTTCEALNKTPNTKSLI